MHNGFDVRSTSQTLAKLLNALVTYFWVHDGGKQCYYKKPYKHEIQHITR